MAILGYLEATLISSWCCNFSLAEAGPHTHILHCPILRSYTSYNERPSSSREKLQHHELIRVASKYPNIAKDYFYNKKHQTVEIIKLNGSVELAPIVGLSEVIVDIVETGATLRENGLEVLEEVCPLSARFVVNQVSMKMENERITKLINDIKNYLENK